MREEFVEAGNKFASDLFEDLDASADRLGLVGDEIRDRGRKMLEIEAQVIFLRLAGQDTSIEDLALQSSAQSLKAAGAGALAEEAQKLVKGRIDGIFDFVIGLLT